MEIVEEVLNRHSAGIKKLEVLMEKRKELERVLNARKDDIRDVEQINNKVRELDRQIKKVCSAKISSIFNDICDEDETSMASSSNEDETSMASSSHEDETSMASSSYSEGPEDETLSSKLIVEEQKQTVVGQGGIGRTKIINKNSKIKYRYGKVKIVKNNFYQRKSRKRRE